MYCLTSTIDNAVSVASGECIFGKVKLIKTNLRSAMIDKQLCSLSVIAIEWHAARELDYRALIDEFTVWKA